MIKLILVNIFIWVNLNAFDSNRELDLFKNITKEIHNSINYGVGSKEAFFNDEIVEYGEGHCGHLSLMLARKLISLDYSFEIITIATYNRRDHSMVQVKSRNNDNNYFLLDPTTNLVYMHSVEDILKNPELSKNVLEKGVHESYSNIDFWSSVRQLQYIPYLGIGPLKNIKEIKTDEELFFSKPNDVSAIFDYSYNSYGATKTSSSKTVDINITFESQNRLSSIVIFPYSNEDYPKKVELKCDNKTIYKNDYIELKRSMIVINLQGDDNCQQLDFNFGNFQGQDRLLLRDIYIYGK